MKLIELISSPVKTRILKYMQEHETATTKEISSELKDIAIPTLYRNINEMVKNNFLKIKEEIKIRGSVQRILTLNREFLTDAENDEVSKTAYQFLMGVYLQFKNYSEKTDTDPIRDLLMLRTYPFKISDENFMKMLVEIRNVLIKYQGDDESGKVRLLSVISVPGD